LKTRERDDATGIGGGKKSGKNGKGGGEYMGKGKVSGLDHLKGANRI